MVQHSRAFANPACLLFQLVACLLCLPPGLTAQIGTTTDHFSVQGSSDYSVTVHYSLQDFCPDPANYIVYLQTGTGTSNEMIIHQYNTNGTRDGNFIIPFGPGQTQVVDAWAAQGGGLCLAVSDPITMLTLTTEAIRSPGNVSASDGILDTAIVITWERRTDIPEADIQYIIYRDGISLDTVPGTDSTFTDQGLMPGQSFDYAVTTYTTAYGNPSLESSPTATGAFDSGSTFTIGLVASDGDFYNKTKLTWNNMSAVATDIRIERSVPGSMTLKEELAILNKNATAYTDPEGIPGFPYTYFVTPLSSGGSFLTDSNPGYSRPNGKISGYVRSAQGIGVNLVDVYVELVTPDLPVGGAQSTCATTTYCTQTDISGYYEIDDIYYYTEAEFKIYPAKGSTPPHTFEPDTVYRKLNTDSRILNFVDFKDLNVLSVSGHVTFPAIPGISVECGVKDIAILVNGDDIGIRTDANGMWATAINDDGTYTFTPKFHDHQFENANGAMETTVYINLDRDDLDFSDITQRNLHLVAQGGCQIPLGSGQVDILIATPDGCYMRAVTTNPDGLLTLSDLPPQEYTVDVVGVNAGANTSNILEQLDEISIDLSKPDTLIQELDSLHFDTIATNPALDIDTIQVFYKDTSYPAAMLRFIYHYPLQIAIDFAAAGAEIAQCPPGEELVILAQNDTYVLEIFIEEENGCPVDQGKLHIYDEISDMEGTRQEVLINEGIARYLVTPGEPDMAESAFHNHEKYLFVIPKVDFAEPEPSTFWALVTGLKSATPSFITRTPEIPQLVIHDPPGDNSFATIEKGTTYTTISTTELQTGGEFGAYLNLKAGPQLKILETTVRGGGVVEFSVKGGRDNMNNDATINSITFLETWSTSPSETFIGDQGDVFMGFALNQTFAPTQELIYDVNTCEAYIDETIQLGFADFATTFIYTEYHIRNTLIPQLRSIMQVQDTLTNEGKKEYNLLKADIEHWTAILEKNEKARNENAAFQKNISFSAGADYTATVGTSRGVNNSFAYTTFLESSLKVGAFAEIDGTPFYLAVEGGVMANFRTSTTELRDTTTENTRAVTYTLSDNDIGDFFSVDVLQDTVYDVPAFRIVSGTSSCPLEPNTQPREVPEIGVYPPIINNVPSDEAANFVLSITNLSESGETRQYAVKLVSNSNPDGAVVSVAGSDVNTFPVTYFFDANQTLDLSMSVLKGPLSANYDSIGITIYSECEYDIWGEGGNLTQADTAWFSVNFLSDCSNVSLHLPNQGWLVNQASNNTLHTAITGYDLNNPYLESITLQLKRKGQGYLNVATIQKSSLIGPFYDLFLDVTNYQDGEYTLRARANCGLNGGTTYSSEVTGIIDRTSLAPFGIPTPSDGFLREGQEVSVSFDKLLNCTFDPLVHQFSLTREDTGEEIPFTPVCSGNKVIFNTNPPLIDQLDLQGVLVIARVDSLQDENDNFQEYPTEWSFLVNVSPVFWDPDLVEASGYEGVSHTVTGILKNTSLLSKAFSLDTADAPLLISYPEWLTPVQKHGTILPSNDYSVEFLVDPGLKPGLYSGTVTAMVDELPVSMDVTFAQLARPVYWPFDPGQYQYTMNVVTQFSLDETNTNLSTDTRDLVAAFVNGQVRGIANIEYVPDRKVYRAFLTVYSNNQGGGGAETVSFRFWHALNGIEYGALETLTFTLDQSTGTISNPLILHPQGFFQDIPLNKGWTWISFNVASNDMSREHVFQNILNAASGNAITVKSKSQTSQYSPGSGWNGNLSTLALGQGYLVYLSNAPDTLRVVGFPSETTINVPVVNNWNWIGFPRLSPEPVNSVLAGLNTTAGDLLKSQYKFSAFDTNNGWEGNLKNFEPGQGYKLKLANAGTITFQPSRSDGYELDDHLYEYNMNVTGEADLALIGEQGEGDFIVGAFIGGQCRGTGTIEHIAALDANRILMLVNGNVEDLGKPVEFRFLNTVSGNEYIANGDQLHFTADGIIGFADNPYHFFEGTTGTADQSAEGFALEQNRPNPTDGHTQIRFIMPSAQHVTLVVYDVNGNLVRTLLDQELSAGWHTIDADLKALPAGFYYYEMRTDEFRGVKKLIRR